MGEDEIRAGNHWATMEDDSNRLVDGPPIFGFAQMRYNPAGLRNVVIQFAGYPLECPTARANPQQT